MTGGLARCALCDGPMAVVAQKPRLDGSRGVAYSCHPTIRPGACGKVSISSAETVEAYVIGQVLDALDDPKMVGRLRDHPDPARATLLAGCPRPRR